MQNPSSTAEGREYLGDKAITEEICDLNVHLAMVSEVIYTVGGHVRSRDYIYCCRGRSGGLRCCQCAQVNRGLISRAGLRDTRRTCDVRLPVNPH